MFSSELVSVFAPLKVLEVIRMVADPIRARAVPGIL